MVGPTVRRSFAAGLSVAVDPVIAIAEAVGSVLEQLDGEVPDLAVLFVAGDHIAVMDDLVNVVAETLRPGCLVAVSAVGVVGGGEEVEVGPAVSLWAGRTGAVAPVRLESLDPRPDAVVLGIPEEIQPGSVLMVLADPFSFPVDQLLEQLPRGVAVVGGSASAATRPGENRLWLNRSEYRDGAVGVIFPPGVARPVVSQGCRPIGEPWVITAGEGNLVHELGGRPAVERLEEMIAGLSPEDRAAAARGLHIGVVANEQREQFEQGDFLVRGVLGIERTSRGVAVGDRVEVGKLVQFQVRDPASASADLVAVLSGAGTGRGALVFTCNGRGTNLFAEPNHDAEIVTEFVSGGVAGMFCAGEFGPIGTRNAVHGFTATVVTFGELP
jgi:small ligand-binding sensory domain FIST